MKTPRHHFLHTRLDKTGIRRLYGRLAAGYDRWGDLTESRARKRCLELAAIRNGESVLEVAVGTGVLFEQILRINPDGRNEGVDLTQEMLERARARAEKTGAGHYALKVGDAYALEYADASFDVVLNNYMFDLIPEKDFPLVLGEFKRVLRPGGRLVLANMTRGGFLFRCLWEGLYRINPAWLGGCRPVSLAPYVEAAGFTGVRREYIRQWLFPSEVLYARKPRAGVNPGGHGGLRGKSGSSDMDKNCSRPDTKPARRTRGIHKNPRRAWRPGQR